MEGGTYEQPPKPLLTLTVDCKMCDEIVFLIEKRVVTINNNSYNWNGKVSEAEYNSVKKGEFELIYSVIR